MSLDKQDRDTEHADRHDDERDEHLDERESCGVVTFFVLLLFVCHLD